jgi:hypothetical protein
MLILKAKNGDKIANRTRFDDLSNYGTCIDFINDENNTCKLHPTNEYSSLMVAAYKNQ